ncbi:hypothetical protein EMCRGX_G013513 [Ephydatia muelleri]
MGMLRSATGVQQGDPLGPLLFSFVLHGLILKIAEDDMCGELLFNKWYLDDGVLAGTSLSVRAALDVISSLGPSLGLYINFAKCEVFGKAELSAFPSEITKRYHTPQLEILGAPIGNEESYINFVINKQSSVSFLLQQLQGLEKPQLALALLRKQGCDMATSEMQWGIKWWLGLPLTPEIGVCAYCPDKALDAHHAVTCKFGGDVVARHNALRNAIFDFCKRALLNPKLEAGAGLVMKGDLLDLQTYSSQAGPMVISLQPLMCPSPLRLNQTFCLKRVWWQVPQQGKQKRESTHAMIQSAPNWDGSVYHKWWRRLVLGEELQASFLENSHHDLRLKAIPQRLQC